MKTCFMWIQIVQLFVVFDVEQLIVVDEMVVECDDICFFDIYIILVVVVMECFFFVIEYVWYSLVCRNQKRVVVYGQIVLGGYVVLGFGVVVWMV